MHGITGITYINYNNWYYSQVSLDSQDKVLNMHMHVQQINIKIHVDDYIISKHMYIDKDILIPLNAYNLLNSDLGFPLNLVRNSKNI